MTDRIDFADTDLGRIEKGDIVKQIVNFLGQNDKLAKVIDISNQNGIIKLRHEHLISKDTGWSPIQDFKLVKKKGYKIGIGDKVKVIKQTHGWGGTSEGSIGIVKKYNTSNNTLSVDFVGHTHWSGREECFLKLTKGGREMASKGYDVKCHTRKNQEEKVTTYLDFTLHKETIDQFLNLAKGIKRDISVIDWTEEKVFEITKKKLEKDYIVFIPHPSRGRERTFPLMFKMNKKIVELQYCEQIYTMFEDEWSIFKSLYFIQLMTDDNKTYYGDGTKNFIRLFVDIVKPIPANRKIFMEFFVKNVIKVWPNLQDTTKLQAKKMGEGYYDFVQNGQIRIETQLKTRFQERQNEMRNYYKGINRMERELGEINNQMTSLKNTFDEHNKKLNQSTLQKIFYNLLKQKMYTKFLYGMDSITAYTENIYIRNFGKQYKIGEFEIIIKFNSEILMKNLTHPSPGAKDHPHVAQKIPCLGTIKEIVTTMITNGDFLGLFILLHKFLTSYSCEGAYRQVELGWGKPGEDWCSRCDWPSMDCHCSTCRDCGEPSDVCRKKKTCPRCPAWGGLLKYARCKECEHYEKDKCGYKEIPKPEVREGVILEEPIDLSGSIRISGGGTI